MPNNYDYSQGQLGMNFWQPAPIREIVKVNGENGANMLPMAPRSSVIALDESVSDFILAWFIQTDDAGYKQKTPYVLTPYKQPDTMDERLKKIEGALNELQQQFKSSCSNAEQAAESESDK